MVWGWVVVLGWVTELLGDEVVVVDVGVVWKPIEFVGVVEKPELAVVKKFDCFWDETAVGVEKELRGWDDCKKEEKALLVCPKLPWILVLFFGKFLLLSVFAVVVVG